MDETSKLEEITFSLEAKDKERLLWFLEDTGLSMNSCFRMYVKQILRHQEIPFDLECGEYFGEIKENGQLE